MNHTPHKASSDDLAERRRKRETERTARQLELAQDALNRRGHTFDHFHQIGESISLSPQDLCRVCEADADIADDLWADLAQRTTDRRYAEGVGPFVPAPRTQNRDRVAPRTQTVRSVERVPDGAIDYIKTIEARDYLPALAGVEPLQGNRVRCPLPDHEDSNPSATFTGTVWFCHSCARGGDLIALAEELSGIPARGRDFIELARWISDRLIERAVETQASLEAKAA